MGYKVDFEAVKALLMKEDKSGLFYILRMFDYKRYGYSYEESFKKKELQQLVCAMPEQFYMLWNAHLYKQHITKID